MMANSTLNNLYLRTQNAALIYLAALQLSGNKNHVLQKHMKTPVQDNHSSWDCQDDHSSWDCWEYLLYDYSVAVEVMFSSCEMITEISMKHGVDS